MYVYSLDAIGARWRTFIFSATKDSTLCAFKPLLAHVISHFSCLKALFLTFLFCFYCLVPPRNLDSKTIDAVLYEGGVDDADASVSDQTISQGEEGTSSSSSNANRASSSGLEGENDGSKKGQHATPIPAEEEEATQIEYSKLLQWIKAKDYITALERMDRDKEEYGRFLKSAKESHITAPEDVLEFVIKGKFFDSVRSNSKHASAVYAVLYMALETEVTEALHFLLIHTSTEFEAQCKAIIASTVSNVMMSDADTMAERGENGEENQNSSQREDSSKCIGIEIALAKIFESVNKMMEEYAYVETFGLKRNLLLLRSVQPILERHALSLMGRWLKTSRFDEYALIIPSNDWKLYEEFQLAKLGINTTENSELENIDNTANSNNTENSNSSSISAQSSSLGSQQRSNDSNDHSQHQKVPSVRVGGRLDPMKVVLTLDQFAVISQLVESYKAHIRRLYEKGIEEMREKGHSFVDLGEQSSSGASDGLPYISSASETVHNIRAYVSEPSQLFTFVQRKTESYKQLESWFLGSALNSVYTSISQSSLGGVNQQQKPNSGDGEAQGSSESEKKTNSEYSPSTTPQPAQIDVPTSASVFSAQKIDNVFALLLRSMERAISVKNFEVTLALIRRAASLAPSFVLSLFLRYISNSIPKPPVEASCKISESILKFHGESLDYLNKTSITRKKGSQQIVEPANKHESTPQQGATSTSIWSAGLGGLMNLVGTNAPSSLIPGVKGSITDAMLVNFPKPNVWREVSLSTACASLNDLYLCAKYFPRLHDELEKKMRYFERDQENRRKITFFLGLFKTKIPALFDVTTSVQTLTFALYPGISYFLHQFYRTSYEIGDEEYRAMELNDPWSAATTNWIKSSMEPFKPTLQPQIMEMWVGQVAGALAENIADLILMKRFSAFGALAFDSHLRKVIAALNSLLPHSASFTVRQKFAALKEVTTLLSMENEMEILEIWNVAHEDQSQFFDPTLHDIASNSAPKVTVKWHLASDQVKAYMKCRSDWKQGIIDNLALS